MVIPIKWEIRGKNLIVKIFENSFGIVWRENSNILANKGWKEERMKLEVGTRIV